MLCGFLLHGGNGVTNIKMDFGAGFLGIRDMEV
jgi:hypothetical protein